MAEVGTGTGILALAAARAGATTVVAIDINPNAVRAVEDNAKANGLSQQVRPVCANLFSAIAPRPLFDVILSSPPLFAGEPLELADRAWHAGPNYRDIASRSISHASGSRRMDVFTFCTRPTPISNSWVG
jgi:release factor glutamine methyltransferase